MVPLLWVPIAAALLWRGWARGGVPLVHLPALVAIGVLVWQLIEYSIHRCVWLGRLATLWPVSSAVGGRGGASSVERAWQGFGLEGPDKGFARDVVCGCLRLGRPSWWEFQQAGVTDACCCLTKSVLCH